MSWRSWRVDFAARRRAIATARGATLIEYALGIGLVAIVLIGGVDYLSDESSDELANRGSSIGHPTAEGGPGSTTSTTSGGPSTTSSTTSTTAAPYSPVVELSCTGEGGNKNVCTFSLNPAPPEGATVTWSIEPNEGFTGVPPSVTFTAAGTRSVRANVDGTEFLRSVNCKLNASSGNLVCNKP